MPTDHNIRQLIINKLTDEEYEQAVKNADELYLTPDSGSGGGTDLPDQTGQSGKFLTTNGSTLSWANVPAGTVTSVRVQATSPVQSSTSTAQSTTLNTTISLANGYGDTKNPYGTKTANYVLAGPSSGSAAAPTFRALVKEDIPLASEIATSGGTTTSLVTTGEKYIWDNKQDAGDYIEESDLEEIDINNLVPSQSGNNGKFLTTNGSTVAWATVQGGGGTSDYNDLTNKPSINNITLSGNKTSSDLGLQATLTTQTAYTSKGSATKVPQITTNTLGQVTGITEVTITQPTVNNSTITIQKNSTTIDSFTTNASSAKTINIPIPTTVAELSDSSNYIQNSELEEIDINTLVPEQTDQSGKFLTTNGTTVSWATVQAGPKFLTFTNITASTWVADNTYADYGYKCVLTCNGVTSSDYAQVIFSPSDASSGNYANVCLTGTGTVTIYSKVNTTITILSIIILGA